MKKKKKTSDISLFLNNMDAHSEEVRILTNDHL